MRDFLLFQFSFLSEAFILCFDIILEWSLILFQRVRIIFHSPKRYRMSFSSFAFFFKISDESPSVRFIYILMKSLLFVDWKLISKTSLSHLINNLIKNNIRFARQKSYFLWSSEVTCSAHDTMRIIVSEDCLAAHSCCIFSVKTMYSHIENYEILLVYPPFNPFNPAG